MPAELPRKPPEAAGNLAELVRSPELATLPNLRGAGLVSKPPSPCLPVQVGTLRGAACRRTRLLVHACKKTCII